MSAKICLLLLALCLVLHPIRGAELISVEDFKKVTDWGERQRMIAQAPLEQREELSRVDVHMSLLSMYGDETGIDWEKEEYAARARGFESLVRFLRVNYGNFLTAYESNVEVSI